MNYKKKKYKYKKNRELNSAVQNWAYSKSFAKEVVLRKEFRAFKKQFKGL